MPRSLPLFFFAFILLISLASATPLPQTHDASLSPASAGYLALGLCLPFVLLAILKFAYLRHRRAQTIHTAPDDTPGAARPIPTSVSENEKKSPFVGLGLDASSVSAAGVLRLPPGLVHKHTAESSLWHKPGFSSVSRIVGRSDAGKVDLEGYLVGFLGSPAWETRIQVRRDKVARKHIIGLASPSSALSPCSTLSQRPGPHIGPYLSQGSSRRSHSCSASTHFPSSVGTSARSRSRAANYGSVTSNSQPSNSQRSRRSHRRSASISATASHHASASGSGSMQATLSSKATGSRRHSRFSRTGSTGSKTHSRSLSLSFLEMNSPDLVEPAADFARITTMAIESVSGSAFTTGTSVGTGRIEDVAHDDLRNPNSTTVIHSERVSDGERGTFLRPGQLSLPLSTGHSAPCGITDCASIHPGSPPCPIATPTLPFDSVSGLYPSSASSTRFGLSISSSDVTRKNKPATRDGFYGPRREFETFEVKTVDAHTPQISSQNSPYLSPQYFSPSVLPLSPLSSTRPPASPVLEFQYNMPDPVKGKRMSTGSTSSIRLTVSVTPSPSHSSFPNGNPSPSSSPLPSPGLGFLTASFDGKATYLSPTKSSAAKERTKPLKLPRSRTKVDKNDDEAKKPANRVSVVGLGLSSSDSPALVKKIRQDKDTFESSLSGCATHNRTRSVSPCMPGAMPITPSSGSANTSSSSSSSASKASGKTPSRRRADFSGPTTPNPDAFSLSEGSSGDAKDGHRGTSSEDREEVEGLVFAVDSSSRTGNPSTSKAGPLAENEQELNRKSWQSWDLDDLMTTDGRLDVDAVSAVLGLSATREDDAWSLEARSVHSVDRSDDVDEQLESSIESLIRQPGSQLYPIIEEEDDDAEAPPAPLPSLQPTSSLVEQARPTSYLVVSGQTQLQIPFLGVGRESMLTVSTLDVRGSVNESVLDLDLSHLNVDGLNLNDLQLDVSGFDVDTSGFTTAHGQGVETSLFGLSVVDRREGEDGNVGVAF